MTETTPAERWIQEATAILGEFRGLLGHFRVQVDPALHVRADRHPCPGYLHDERSICFCPPTVLTPVDQLRWTLFRGYMGCESIEEASEFYRDALPLVIAHELTHHLRISRGLASDSAFVEEQRCDQLAVALTEELRGVALLQRIQRHCARMRARLDARLPRSPGVAFLPDATEALRELGAVDDRLLASLDAATLHGNLPVEDLLALDARLEHGKLRDAREARAQARFYMDSHYTSDPAAYWHLSLRWLEGYLRRGRRPGLASALNEHVAPPRPRTFEAVSELEQHWSDEGDPTRREAAALGLLDGLGASVLDDLLDQSEGQADAARLLVRAATKAVLQRRVHLPGRIAERLLRTAMSDATKEGCSTSAAEALRLGALAGLSPEFLEELEHLGRDLGGPLLDLERAAIRPDLERARRILGEQPLDPWFDALLAWRMQLPEESWSALARMPFQPRLLRLAALHRRREPAFLQMAASWLQGARSTASSELIQAALTLLGLGPPELLPCALPRRGTPAFDAALPWLTGSTVASPSGPRQALRWASARGDLAGLRPDAVPEIRRGALDVLAQGHGARSSALALGESDLERLAREEAHLEGYRAACEVLLALVAKEKSSTLLRLIEEQGAGLPPPPLADLLLASLPGDTWRAAVSPLLSRGEDAQPREESPSPKTTLEPLRFLFEEIARRGAAGYRGEAVLSLMERLVLLRAVPLFEQVELEPLLKLAEKTVEWTLPAGAFLFREGDAGDRLFLLQRGQVRVLSSAGVELNQLAPPSCIGEIALIDGQPRSASVQAATECVFLALDGVAIRQVGHEAPAFFEALLRVLAGRVRRLSDHLPPRATSESREGR